MPAPDNVQVWILSGLLTLVSGTLLVLGKVLAGHISKAFAEVISELKAVVKEIQNLQMSRATQAQDIKQLQEEVEDHEERLRKIEFTNQTLPSYLQERS